MGECNRDIRLSALWSPRIPTAIRRQWPARGRMFELRKGLDVRSVDVVGTAGGGEETEAARCGDVGERLRWCVPARSATATGWRELRRACAGWGSARASDQCGEDRSIARRTGMNRSRRRMFPWCPCFFRAWARSAARVSDRDPRWPAPGTPVPARAARAAGTAWRSSVSHRARRSCAGNRGRGGCRRWSECCRSWK